MNKDLELRKQIGERIRKIRNELKMTKDALGKELNITGQFLGVVESGKSTISYEGLRKLCDISGYSADYILFGKDTKVIYETKKNLEKLSDEQIQEACEIINKIAIFMRDSDESKQEELEEAE